MASNSDSFFYVPADSPIKTIDDLKGKSIAYSPPGSVSEVLLRDLGTEKHIEFKTVSGGALDAIFTMTMTRQIDVGMSVPPTAVDALRKGEIRLVFDGNAVESQRDVVNRVSIANGNFVKNRRAVGTKFLTVLHDCIDWMYAHRDQPAKMYATLKSYRLRHRRALLGLLSARQDGIVEAHRLPCGRRADRHRQVHRPAADRDAAQVLRRRALYGSGPVRCELVKRE